MTKAGVWFAVLLVSLGAAAMTARALSGPTVGGVVAPLPDVRHSDSGGRGRVSHTMPAWHRPAALRYTVSDELADIDEHTRRHIDTSRYERRGYGHSLGHA